LIYDTLSKSKMDLDVVAYLEYVASNPLERKAMEIAKDHLGSSFDLTRSNGFRAWIQKTKKV
jgi:hypothetical protein